LTEQTEEPQDVPGSV